MGTHSLPLPFYMTTLSVRPRRNVPPPPRLTAQQRASCVVREVSCKAEPGAVRPALEQAVAVELGRMRALHESDDVIHAFLAASEIHVAHCEVAVAIYPFGSPTRIRDKK